MHQTLLQEQLAYYRARAAEYDASLQPLSGASAPPVEHPEWAQAGQALRALGPYPRVLELAGGTGIWTKTLVQLTADLTVLDGAPEMLALNQTKVANPRVRYACVDLFSWEPEGEYELVFFAFWLSHVPPELLEPFLRQLRWAVAPGGRVFIVDEPAGGQQVSGPAQAGLYQQRTLHDGRQFNIIKVYYDPAAIQQRLQAWGFTPEVLQVGASFFHLSSVRQ